MPHICLIGLDVRHNLGHSLTVKYFLDCQWLELFSKIKKGKKNEDIVLNKCLYFFTLHACAYR